MNHLMFEHPENEPVLTLTEEQCRKLLDNTRHGRFAFADGPKIEIFPINYVRDGDLLYFRTAPGSKLAAAEHGLDVAFETDGILPEQAWSVVVRGVARMVTDTAELEHVRQLGIAPWVPTLKDFFASISIEELSGRHFIFGRQPERDEDRGFRYDPDLKTSEPPRHPDTSRLSCHDGSAN
ncbi:pyridoxamine 5'-phosphate oxidase family protein [Auritidibacter sp. NML130574]|uniref:pyridoxamine 5'-phosphate oxidase family protein n=1 Tax=Auritidibacter sp. NML130574 TaxID=2170745 RepID=UPI001FEF3890|nr:pyridoxamine 5'-phosphate oxidase family protein [Auritidibacter sp. NML130574]